MNFAADTFNFARSNGEEEENAMKNEMCKRNYFCCVLFFFFFDKIINLMTLKKITFCVKFLVYAFQTQFLT